MLFYGQQESHHNPILFDYFKRGREEKMNRIVDHPGFPVYTFTKVTISGDLTVGLS